MTYELAKQLKDTGFKPVSKYRLDAYLDHDHVGWVETLNNWEDKYTYIPTLSELIEACEDRFHSLYHPKATSEGLYWLTESCVFEGKDTVQEGSTPEEAVANLWLALNKSEEEDNDDIIHDNLNKI